VITSLKFAIEKDIWFNLSGHNSHIIPNWKL